MSVCEYAGNRQSAVQPAKAVPYLWIFTKKQEMKIRVRQINEWVDLTFLHMSKYLTLENVFFPNIFLQKY